MNIEQSIELLKSSAELRIDKANTQQKVNSANNFAEAVNNIIDIHIKAQEYRERYTNAQKSLSFTLKLIGVLDYDIERLITIDYKFLRYHLIAGMYMILQKKENDCTYKGMSDKWLFHDVVIKWDCYQDAVNELNFYRKIQLTAKEEYAKTFYNKEIERLESEIKCYTDYSDIEEMENYIKTW